MLDNLILIWFILSLIFTMFFTVKSTVSLTKVYQWVFLGYLLIPVVVGAAFNSLAVVLMSTLGAYFLHNQFGSRPLVNICSVLLLWLPFEFELYKIGYETDLPVTFAMIILMFYSIYFLFSNQNRLVSVRQSFKLTSSDIKISMIGYLGLVSAIVPIGFGIGFLKFTLFEPSLWLFFNALFVGYFLVALPEELLFRYLMTDLLRPFISKKNILLLVTAVIFGVAHLNNQAQDIFQLNWGYCLLATIAGIGYGAVFYKTNKVSAAAITHMLVNFTWALFFNSPY